MQRNADIGLLRSHQEIGNERKARIKEEIKNKEEKTITAALDRAICN